MSLTEDQALRIKSFAIVEIHGVSTIYKLYITRVVSVSGLVYTSLLCRTYVRSNAIQTIRYNKMSYL